MDATLARHAPRFNRLARRGSNRSLTILSNKAAGLTLENGALCDQKCTNNS